MCRRTAIILSVLLLAGCSTATPYQSSVAGYFVIAGGYDEVEKGNGVWHVSFSGDRDTSRQTMQTYWLYRCAELTLKEGYDGFEILSPIRLIDEEGDPRLYDYGDFGDVYHTGADIRMIKKPFTPVASKVFEAMALKAALEPYVTGKKCDRGNVCPHPHSYLHAGAG